MIRCRCAGWWRRGLSRSRHTWHCFVRRARIAGAQDHIWIFATRFKKLARLFLLLYGTSSFVDCASPAKGDPSQAEKGWSCRGERLHRTWRQRVQAVSVWAMRPSGGSRENDSGEGRPGAGELRVMAGTPRRIERKKSHAMGVRGWLLRSSYRDCNGSAVTWSGPEGWQSEAFQRGAWATSNR